MSHDIIKTGYVYLLASDTVGTLYIGVTSNLLKRIIQHKEGSFKGFTSKYGVHKLVYFELHASMESAIQREKELKKWRRQWKIQLIEKDNPKWEDLFPHLYVEEFGTDYIHG